jgi:hypothetical protein
MLLSINNTPFKLQPNDNVTQRQKKEKKKKALNFSLREKKKE